MYSFYVLCGVGSEKDGIGKSGLAHVLEHFLILALINDFFTDDGNLRGQTSYCYSLYSWTNGSFQAGIRLMSGFEDYVRKILKNKNEYVDFMLAAIKEVEKEIRSKRNETIKYREMIFALNKNILSLPIGFIEDVKNLKVEQLFDAFDDIYEKDDLKYFVFDHDKNEFVRMSMLQKINQKDCKTIRELSDKEFEQALPDAKVEMQAIRIFGKGLKKLALPRPFAIRIISKEQVLLNELYLLNICKVLNEIYKIGDNFKFETIFFGNADSIIRYDIFELTGYNDVCGIANNIAVDKKLIMNLLLDTTNFLELKAEFESIVFNNRFRSITRGECEAEILNIVYFNNGLMIKDYKEFVDLFQNITIDKYKRFLHLEIKNIDNLKIFE